MTRVATALPLARTTVKNTLTGDLQGTSVAELLMCRADEDHAGYVASERVTGRLEGREGSFVLQHGGLVDGETLNPSGTSCRVQEPAIWPASEEPASSCTTRTERRSRWITGSSNNSQSEGGPWDCLNLDGPLLLQCGSLENAGNRYLRIVAGTSAMAGLDARQSTFMATAHWEQRYESSEPGITNWIDEPAATLSGAPRVQLFHCNACSGRHECGNTACD